MRPASPRLLLALPCLLVLAGACTPPAETPDTRPGTERSGEGQAGAPGGSDSNARSDRAGAATPAPLLGTTWHLASLTGEPPAEAGTPEQRPHLQLIEEGRVVQGSGGCNRLQGTYELEAGQPDSTGREEGTLTFHRIAATKRGCLSPLNQQEKAFLEALTATTRYTLQGGELVLLGEDWEVARFGVGEG